MFASELFYFENMIQKFQQDLAKPLMEKRIAYHKDDPLEELNEVYTEIKQIETNFKKVLEISSKYLKLFGQ